MSGLATDAASNYAVELLLPRAVRLDQERLRTALSARHARLDVAGLGEQLIQVALPELAVPVGSGHSMPYTILLEACDRVVIGSELAEAIEQSWEWPGARAAVACAAATLRVSDFMAAGLDRDRRLAAFHSVVEVLARLADARAIHWLPSGRIVDPRALAAHDAAVHVRRHRVSERAGETLMDTMGLAALGLPDLQCRFAGREPGDVALLLRHCASYLLEHGDVIRDGAVVPGIAGERWTCRRAAARAAPSRWVIDLSAA